MAVDFQVTSSGAVSASADSSAAPEVEVSRTTFETETHYWRPTVDSESNISWAMDESTTPPEPKNIRGATGATGATGADGYSPSASVTKSGTRATITVTDKSGTTTAYVDDGSAGQGVPTGGTAGQVLMKQSATDYDTNWGLPSGYVHYIEGNASDTAGVWTGTDSTITAYENGLTVVYVPKVAGASTTTLNINGLGGIVCYINSTKLTTHFAAGTPIVFTYYNGVFKRADYDSNTVSTPYETSGASTAAKTGYCNYYALVKGYLPVNMRYSNTASSALTLNINETGAKPIYINGSASSASNYTLPAGIYLVYYDGTSYYFRTDGGIENVPRITIKTYTLTLGTSAWQSGYYADQDISSDITSYGTPVSAVVYHSDSNIPALCYFHQSGQYLRAWAHLSSSAGSGKSVSVRVTFVK